jgi:hypothetical protein
MDGAVSFLDGAATFIDGVVPVLAGAATFMGGVVPVLAGAATFIDGVVPVVAGAATFMDGAVPVMTGAARFEGGIVASFVEVEVPQARPCLVVAGIDELGTGRRRVVAADRAIPLAEESVRGDRRLRSG